MNSINRPMFKVIVTMGIWTCEESVVDEYISGHRSMFERDDPRNEPKRAILRKELALPFAPFIGLQLESDGWDCPPLNDIRWSDQEQVFRCRIPDQYPGMAVDTYLSFEDLLEMSQECGWIRQVRGGGDAPRTTDVPSNET